MRRIQVHIDEDLDDAAAAEATRRGISKAALIRVALAKEVPPPNKAEDPWEALIGWLDDVRMNDDETIDDVVYGPKDH